MDGRLLTSVRLRNALFLGYDGKCAICKRPLPTGWHADHIVRFCESGRTNVHEMQPLCPPCHIAKTSKENQKMIDFDMTRYELSGWKLRTFQRQFLSALQAVARGAKNSKGITGYMTPSSGKSSLPMMAAQLVEIGFADSLCWVVPRSTLVEQGVAGFYHDPMNPVVKALAGQNKAPIIHPDDVERYNHRAYVTTYQAIAAAPEIHEHWFKSYRTILVLDELHHLADDDDAPAWTKAITPLVELSPFCLRMTGTIERHDGKRIPFVEYEERDVNGEKRLYALRDIEYTRQQALAECAKLEIKFHYCNGMAEYICLKDEKRKQVEISGAGKDERSAVLTTMLAKGEFVTQMLSECLDHFQHFRKETGYSEAKAILVFDRQADATTWGKWVRETYGLKTTVAISNDPKAQANIGHFKKPNNKGGVEVLCTVGMAYEGLDVRNATHLACLNKVRSAPWLEQCFDRPTRVAFKPDGCPLTPESQIAFVWVPDDPWMQEVVSKIQAEQEAGVKERDKRNAQQGGEGTASDSSDPSYVSLNSQLTDLRFGDTKGDFKIKDNVDESAWIKLCQAKYPALRFLQPRTLLEMRSQGAFKDIDQAYAENQGEQATPGWDHSDPYKATLESINILAKKVNHKLFRGPDGQPQWGTVERMIHEHFGIKTYGKRSQSIDTLKQIEQYLITLLSNAS